MNEMSKFWRFCHSSASLLGDDVFAPFFSKSTVRLWLKIFFNWSSRLNNSLIKSPKDI